MENADFQKLSDREILIKTYLLTNENIKKVEDHEKRIRTLERLGALLIGGLYVLDFLSKIVKL